MNHVKKTYVVYDNKTDLPVIVDGVAEECAAVMGVSVGTFYACASKGYKHNRWTVVRSGVRRPGDGSEL